MSNLYKAAAGAGILRKAYKGMSKANVFPRKTNLENGLTPGAAGKRNWKAITRRKTRKNQYKFNAMEKKINERKRKMSSIFDKSGFNKSKPEFDEMRERMKTDPFHSDINLSKSERINKMKERMKANPFFSNMDLSKSKPEFDEMRERMKTDPFFSKKRP